MDYFKTYYDLYEEAYNEHDWHFQKVISVSPQMSIVILTSLPLGVYVLIYINLLSITTVDQSVHLQGNRNQTVGKVFTNRLVNVMCLQMFV